MEGALVDHVRRVISGQGIYIEPSLEFTAYLYTPLFYYIAAVVSPIFGDGFPELRLLSFLSSLGCFLFIYLIVKRETGNRFHGLLASGLFVATYNVSGAFFDLAREDTLYLLFVLIVAYLVRFGTTWKHFALAGLFLSLAFLTKQAALIIAGPIVLYCFIKNWRQALWFTGVATALVAGSTIIFNYIYDGWFVYYVFQLPLQHPIEQKVWLLFWRADILKPLFIACGVAAVYIFAELKNIFRFRRKDNLFYILIPAGLVLSSWSARLHTGGYVNVLIPAYAGIALLFGLGINKIAGLLEAGDRRKIMLPGFYLIIIAQFALLLYNPANQIPSEEDLEAGRQLTYALQQFQGEVFLPYHGYLPELAGKNSYAHWPAMGDVLRAGEDEMSGKLENEIRQAIREQRFNAIVLDNPVADDPIKLFWDDINANYRQLGPVFQSDSVFWPVTGRKTRPELIYVPRQQEGRNNRGAQ